MSRAHGLVLVTLLSGCLPGEVDLEGKQCPCAIGWFCDPVTRTCTLTPLPSQDAGLDADDAGLDAGDDVDAGVDAATTDAGDGGGGPTDAGVDGGGAGDYPTVVLADGPVGYWRLDEAAGSTMAVDASGNGNHGSYVGGVTLGSAGAVPDGTAAHLDGIDGRIVFGDRFDFAGVTPFSLEAWFQLAAGADDGLHMLLDKEATSSPREGYTVFVRPPSADGTRVTMGFERWRDQALPGAPNTTMAFPHDRFTHVVVTFDGARGWMYIDGVLVANEISNASLVDNAGPFVVGSHSAESIYFFDGVVDEVAVYDHALDAERIAAHYAAGSAD